MSTQVARKKPNQVIFDIQKSNMTQLLDPNNFDHFTESVFNEVRTGCNRIPDNMHKFESTIDHIDITFDGPEDGTDNFGEGFVESYNIVDAVIRSFWEINRDDLNKIMLANNFAKNMMDDYIAGSLSILDMSPKDRETRVYRINLHP